MDGQLHDFLNACKVLTAEEADERNYFYLCEECGQAVDYRRLGDVLHHDEPGHRAPPVQ